MKEFFFSGKYPITILLFPNNIKKHFGNNRISEGEAIQIISDYMEDPARSNLLRHFDVGPDLSGGIDTCPQAVQYLLETYTKDAY